MLPNVVATERVFVIKKQPFVFLPGLQKPYVELYKISMLECRIVINEGFTNESLHRSKH